MSDPRPGPTELSAELSDHLRDPFDSVFSDPNRLRIQAALHGLTNSGSIRFTALAKALHLSDGNLSTHLASLSEVGYVTSSSTYTGKRRTRWFSATARGREAFETHVHALQFIVDAAKLAGGDPAPRRPSAT